jgi:hypothetical protein
MTDTAHPDLPAPEVRPNTSQDIKILTSAGLITVGLIVTVYAMAQGTPITAELTTFP